MLLGSACDGGDGKNKRRADGGAEEDGDDGGESGDADDGADGDEGGDGAEGDGEDGDGAGNDPDAGVECSVSCDDGNDCTTDDCTEDNLCTHELAPSSCAAGSSCHPEDGCSEGKACSVPEDCEDDDGCTVNERCGGELATCEFDPLDGDDDGQAPSVCGGADCNDADPDVGPGEVERCNGEDDDCDGSVDDQAQCPGEGRVCKEAACVCADGLEQCGQAGCFDLQADPRHCGECGNDCGPAGVCNAGVCECPAPAEECDGYCVDTQTSFLHCGGCGQTCDVNPLEACVEGQCTQCGGDGEACCVLEGLGDLGLDCFGALTCSGTPGTSGATCGCNSPSEMCGDTCVDVTTSREHCGGCDQACGNGEACADTGSGPTCTPCGEAGQPCCATGQGFRYCGASPGPEPGGGPSCNQETLICEN